MAFADLNQALAAARTKVEELSSVTAGLTVVSELKRQVEAATQDQRHLQTDLEQVRAVARRAGAHMAEVKAALEERRQAMVQLAAKEEARVDAGERRSAELARVRQELEAAGRRLASAQRERHVALARLGELKEVLASVLQEVARSRTELESARQELGDASTVYGQTDAARAALERETEELRDEIQQVGHELAAAKVTLARLSVEKAAMADEIVQLRAAAIAATDAARESVAMESKIEALQAASDKMRSDHHSAAEDSGGRAEVGALALAQAVRPPQVVAPALPRPTVGTAQHRSVLTGVSVQTSRPAATVARTDMAFERHARLQALLAKLNASTSLSKGTAHRFR